MGSDIQADARFLRRVLFGMVMMTLVTGAMAGVTTVHAMNKSGQTTCVVFCD